MVAALDHVALVSRHGAAATAFYVDVLGLVRHPTKPNWLQCGSRGAVHILERADLRLEDSPERRVAHVALRVERLEDALERLIGAGCRPFQLSLDYERREVTDRTTDLDWGLGTLFVRDPDGNTVELIEAGRGIFAEHVRDG